MIAKILSILNYNLPLLPNSSYNIKQESKGDYVILLHGIARSSKHMKKLAIYLDKNGFEVINLDYPSTKYKIEELTEIIHQEIILRTPKNKTLHFVGYSMGGLMVRALISKYNYPNLGRVVQLAPPNGGSEVADFVTNFWPLKIIYKKIFGPAGQQLLTDQTSIKDIFGKVNYELGIIAGNVTIDPICWIILPGANDGKVSVERTKLEDMKDHIVVLASHTFFPSSREVQKQTIYFLKEGSFNRLPKNSNNKINPI